jgi:dipeptidyl aminopeptidase/acylaminoacyl peptidase
VKHFSNALQVNAQTPPVFMIHSLDDGAVPVENSIEYALAMKKYKVPCELHIYQTGGHGYGLGRSANTERAWTEACRRWLLQQGLVK